MKFLVAVPVFNEARYVTRVLSAIRRHASDVLVIDDGSSDATPDLLAGIPDIAVIHHPENRGYGQSLIDACAYAARHRYEWIITMDCDEQHEPGQIPCFVNAAARGDADIISGSRYLEAHPGDDDAPPERRQINETINTLLRQILGLALTDSFCGFKAMRVAALERLCLDEPGYAFPLQFWVQCVRAGLRIRELPVRRIYRDTSRTFPGTLDDPSARLAHYLAVFLGELRREPLPTDAPCTMDACCRRRTA